MNDIYGMLSRELCIHSTRTAISSALLIAIGMRVGSDRRRPRQGALFRAARGRHEHGLCRGSALAVWSRRQALSRSHARRTLVCLEAYACARAIQVFSFTLAILRHILKLSSLISFPSLPVSNSCCRSDRGRPRHGRCVRHLPVAAARLPGRLSGAEGVCGRVHCAAVLWRVQGARNVLSSQVNHARFASIALFTLA
jgi:hypothetical protein